MTEIFGESTDGVFRCEIHVILKSEHQRGQETKKKVRYNNFMNKNIFYEQIKFEKSEKGKNHYFFPFFAKNLFSFSFFRLKYKKRLFLTQF